MGKNKAFQTAEASLVSHVRAGVAALVKHNVFVYSDGLRETCRDDVLGFPVSGLFAISVRQVRGKIVTLNFPPLVGYKRTWIVGRRKSWLLWEKVATTPISIVQTPGHIQFGILKGPQ